MGQQLLSVMSDMIRLHEKLIVVSEQKHTALVERDMESLTEVMKSEKDLLQELRAKEETRQELTGELSGDKVQTLKGVLGLLSPPVRRMVESRATELKKQAETLKVLNEQNEELLKDAMAFIHHMIGHLTAPRDQSITYGRPNQKPSTGATRGYFDTKA
ncbi:flagellar protein FlgN [Pseudalkalibacillus hwajinpoensis]|uniref:Flagellar protein FlgN n=1 Tax=Guptibacillus hwajinpoensis TaxID=208199 RepID=A0A4U1MJ09_9BACL|nr:flagellar protein FlgN [Pseudalkalibacillus hwajinpoensis]TKD70535.1 flagellar protein FlgN [Pseudalkalibacillus hwajinpoensis]